MKISSGPGACAGGGSLLACAACALLLCASATGQCGETASEPSFKLTPSWYQSSDGNDASDINLRANLGPHAAWLGYYRDHAGFQQARVGYEYIQDIGNSRLVWSGQSAAGGFLGGSVNLVLGKPWYLIAGFGRTNLHTYYNLNFDPNDAITLGIGATLMAGTELSLFQVRDDRLDTRQRVTHIYLHQELSDKDKLSVDGSYKTGLNEDGVFIRGHAVTVTYAHRYIFIRLAHDRYANFSNATQNRISLGATF
jgi:hypothetical protein